MGKDKMTIELGNTYKRRSPFDFSRIGIKPDPNKDYRWVAPHRVDERKHSDGYSFTKPADGTTSSDGHIKVKNMFLMERPREMADQRRKEKDDFNRFRSSAVRTDLDDRVEALSSKHGVNLHKYVKSEDGD